MRGWRKCFCAILGLVLISSQCYASGFGRNLKVEEEDGSPSSVPVYTVRVPNGHLTQNAVGDVSIDFDGVGVTDHSALSNLDYASAGHTGFFALDQNPTPQTMTLGGGTGLISLTAGVVGLDTNTYLTTESDTLGTVVARGANAGATINVGASNTLTLASGSITDSTGAIDFGNENLTTTGNVTLGADNALLSFGAAGSTDYNIKWDGSDAVHTITAGDFVFTGGNVGIGTTSPSGKLHILNSGTAVSGFAGNLILQRSANAEIVRLSLVGANNAASYINFGDPDDEDIGQIRYSNVTDSMSFYTNNTQQVSILSDGKVGIGTTSPQEALHIYGANVALGIDNTNIGNASILFLKNSGTNTASIISYAASHATLADQLWFKNYRASSIVFAPNNTEAMRITSAGNVGIGTASPSEKLDVVGDIEVSADIHNLSDNGKHYFGASDDASIYYSGTNAVYKVETAGQHYFVNPAGTGIVLATSDTVTANTYHSLRGQGGAGDNLVLNSVNDIYFNADYGNHLHLYDNKIFYFGTGNDGSISFTGSSLDIKSNLITATDELNLQGGTNGIDFLIGATEQITLTDGKLAPTTDNDIDLGDATHRYKDGYFYSGVILRSPDGTNWRITVDDSGTLSTASI